MEQVERTFKRNMDVSAELEEIEKRIREFPVSVTNSLSTFVVEQY
jgi:hypothetical protein